MKTRQLYQSNDFLLHFYLYVPINKGYRSNQEYSIFSAIHEDVYVIKIG